MKRKFKLKRTVIRGYKSVSDSSPLDISFGDTTVLIGANGAGKSNIVSFFKMLGYIMSGSLQLFVERMGTNNSFLYYGSKITPQLQAELLFENDKDYDKYSFGLVPASPDRLIFNNENLEVGSKVNGGEAHSIHLDLQFKESAIATDERTTVKRIRKVLSGCKVYQFHDSSASGPLRQSSTVESAQYLQSEGNNLASFLYYLKDNYPESYNKIESYVRLAVPQFRSFYLEPNKKYISLRWKDTSLNDYVFSVDQFSDGSIRFIALATLLLQPAETMPGVIIIDEPELGLHPYAIDQLIEMIKDASLKAQVIVATQSPALMDGFEVEDVRVVERDEDFDCTVLHTLDADKLQKWLETYSLSELWNKNVIGGRPI
jgi:predicted ATPase